jgi:hypothetical protein
MLWPQRFLADGQCSPVITLGLERLFALTYRPAFFVGKDDNTVGETISGSTGAPGTNRYAGAALHLAAASTAYALHDLRFRNAVKAVPSAVTCTGRFTMSPPPVSA